MKPGVRWLDMQTLSYRVILTHLRDAGLLKGDVDEMMAVNLGSSECCIRSSRAIQVEAENRALTFTRTHSTTPR